MKSALVAAVLVLAAVSPSTALAASSGRSVAVATLHLSHAQRADIHGIIARGRHEGLPTLATRRAVLGVLTPDQQRRLAQIVPATPPAR